MGFLSGAYGKLMAGKLVRDLQYQMTSVQSRLRRVTKEIGLKEKMYQSQERNMKYMLQSQQREMLQGSVNAQVAFLRQEGKIAEAEQLAALGQMYGSAMNGNTSMFAGLGIGIGSINSSITSAYTALQSQSQMQYMQAQTMWQNMFEMQREADLQALKDLEEDLQVEKDNLESRLQIAKAEYDAKKEEEKDGAKNLAPNYTGQ